MNSAIAELNTKLQDANSQREKEKQDLSQHLEVVLLEKSLIQRQIEDLLQELSFAREQIQRAKETITEKETRLNEADKFQLTVEDLKAQLVSASEFRKELELKHEAEVINYKIKLEMLEREKDAVLGRMAESQEAEFERLRTQLLFSHEEELSTLREDLHQEHKINMENLTVQYKQQLDGIQIEMNTKTEAMQFENESLITKQNNLILEISKLKELQQSIVNSKSEEMTLQIHELQNEIEVLRKGEKEKCTLEQEFQELHLKTELLEKQMKEQEDILQEKCMQLETQNNLLKEENKSLEEKFKKSTVVNLEENLIFIDSASFKSEDLDLQKRIEKLIAENEQLTKQDIQLKEETERQKSTFSFAEKKFEVNYQELQEEYACLLKLKSDLEESKIKQEAEYKLKVQELTEELQHLQRSKPAVLKTTSSALDSKKGKIFRSETFDIEEVVEKDTTELMEKLEVTQREKLELSLRLSDLSEQLKLNQNEICQLSKEVKSLKKERDQVLARCTELEVIISHSQTENTNIFEHKIKYSKEKIQPGPTTVSKTRNQRSSPCKQLCEEIKGREGNLTPCNDSVTMEKDIQQKLNPEQQSLLEHLHQMNDRLAGESSLMAITPSENNQLQQQLDILKSEKTDLKLQMEAQRICLSLVYSAHVDQVRECMGNEKENALCSLKEELSFCHAQEMNELKKMHQLELETFKGQQAALYIFKYTCNGAKILMENFTSSLCNLALQANMLTLLSKIMEEYNRLMDLHTPFMMDRKKVYTKVYCLYFYKVRASCREEMQNLKTQLEEQHAQEVERLRSYFQQQLKETEERYTTEIFHLQDRLQNVSESFERFRYCPAELEVNGDMGMIQLLEKRYQERLEEEIAKVIVSMSVEFAQQTELARIARLKEDTALSIVQTRNQHFENQKKGPKEELDGHQSKEKRKDIKYEEPKSLSKELGDECNEIPSTEQFEFDDKLGSVFELSNPDLRLPAEPFSHNKEFMLKGTPVAPSSAETSGQLLLYEECLEDMRQELVRQYQEHQQATEMLRQGHMQQMERQKESQEQLLAELDRLKLQLAESASVDNANLVTERERMLLEELELLKQHSVPGREKLLCELQNSSTQTQSEKESQAESKECRLEGEEKGEKPEETPPDILSKERHALQKANNRLLKILLEVAKTTATMEEIIGHHVLGLLDRSEKGQPSSKPLVWEAEREDSVKPCIRVGYEKESSSSYHGSDLGGDTRMWSGVTEEGLELTQHLIEHGFAGVEINLENEGLVLNISSRLQAAVEKLLEAIIETSNQLEHAKITQTELMRESFKSQQEATEWLRCQEELQERLNEEAKAREQLAIELSKAEGLIDGYADEKAFLEKQIQEKIEVIDHLEQELLCTGNKLQELEAERQQIQEEKELLYRQKDAMKADAGPVEQQLLEETEKLMKEKIEVQRQAEKEYDYLQKQVKALETDVEDQVSRFIELEQEKNAELMDLRQQNQALEKQLEKTRKFLDEQAIDREHERDVFQQEIQKLEQQLKIPQRLQPVNEHQTREVEQLTNHLKEKTDKCSELLLSKEQLQRDVQERNEEIEKLECRIRELEQALIISTDNLHKVEERKQFGAAAVKGEQPLEVQLQAEQEAVDRKEKEITNLEEQLEQFREELENKNEEVQQLHMQLEIQRKESTTRLQELEQENKLFKDEMEKLGVAILNSEDAFIKDHCLVAEKFTLIMQEKEQEIDQLNEQITKLQQQLDITHNKDIVEKNEHIRELEAQIECLKGDQERVKKNIEEEIEQLNEVIEKLQQELANIEQKVPVDFASIQEDADSLKHQLDIVLAEKEALMKQVEDNSIEASVAKNELEETKLKMKQLKKEVGILKKEHEKMAEKCKNVQMKTHTVKTGQKRNKEKDKLEEVPSEKAETPENKIPLECGEENAKDTMSNMEAKIEQLQETIKEKDSELSQCYNKMRVLEEQVQVETEKLKQKILEREEILEQTVAAALVSHAELKAVQEQSRLRQEIQAASTGTEEVSKASQTEDVNQLAKDDAGSKLSILAGRLSQLENQLAKVHMNLQLEKEKVEVAQNEAKEKEKRLQELQQLLGEIEEKHKKEIAESSRQGKVQTSEVNIFTDLLQNKGGSVLVIELELEKIRAESAAAKEELSNCREKAEKLQEELVVKETSVVRLQEELNHTKDSLFQAEKKLAGYVRKEEEVAQLQSQKDFGKPESVSTKEEPAPIRKSSSSQTDKTMHINSCNQTSQVLVKNAQIQIDLQSGCSSEEVAEIIREFTEKIDQMQELHAAEIIDMETRHISESEALKREQFVAVQVLTEECNALKEVIETLRAKEGVPISELAHFSSFQARDGCSSESSSDWSQGIYLAQSQGSDTVSEGVGEEGETSTDLLSKKIKGLLRAVHHEGIQVLSLTEFPYGESDAPSLKLGPGLGHEERSTLLSTISLLKDLISKMQLHREAEIYTSSESPESIPDWRGELLHAVQQVFLREQDVLLAAFQTELAELGTRDAMVLMGQLEHRLQEQDISHRTAMDCIQNADRRSLLMEIQVLRTQINSRKINPKREQEFNPKSQELLEYSMQQKQSQMLEMQVELRSVKERAAELQEQLNSERMVVAELKNELAQAKLELETTLKAQHKHLKDLETVRNDVKEKAAELDILKDTMANEQKKSRELQWALEKEMAKMERSKERGREELEDLKYSLEDQNKKNTQLNKLLEHEKQLSSDLQQKMESQDTLNAAQLLHEHSRNSELQVLLESEKVRVREISSALEREKELCAQLRSAEDERQEGALRPTEELLKDLQKQLDEKHDRIVELVSEMERYKLESVQVRQQMEKERQIHRKTLQAEQEANILAQKKVHELESKVEDLQWQLGEKRQQVHKLQHEEKKLQEIIQELQKREQERENKREAERATCQNLNQTTWDTSNERTRKWILQQKMEEAETKESTFSALTAMKGGGDLTGVTQVLENIKQKLQHVSSKLKQLAQKAACRLQFEKADDEDFIGIQNNIEEILLELRTLPGLALMTWIKRAGDPRVSAKMTRVLSARIQLAYAFVADSSTDMLRWASRSPRRSLDNVGNADALLASEREMWNKEKLSLQHSLKQADAEMAKLRAELRNEAFVRELGSDSENAALKRIYGKYLRAESFRKALIYQKKYLLLLLGGFQECEEATLALIARMGGQPSYTDLEVITHRSKGFTRFRSAVRVSIAISRMKFLVRRWHRVTGSSLISVNRDGFSQNAGNEVRPDSFSSSLELYGEHRHSYRSRSDLESPRSLIYSQHSIHADLTPVSLACSQLQNYDPDRALTDYINRLEALQRRLGSVQSVSTSHTQLHSGTRR
uniref:Pericentrin/AKAP-450 centrosomal targeting domain-containing protein n=1 Tax=Sphenodon punctatus TaxID=8508 RepID=A0A8D0G315_SPHPU